MPLEIQWVNMYVPLPMGAWSSLLVVSLENKQRAEQGLL